MEIMLFLFGTFIGIPISYGIYGTFTFIIESLFGREVYAFKYLIFSYTKSTGFHICHFSPVCEISMQKENDTEKKVMTSFMIKTILYYIVCATVIFLTVKIYRYNILPSFLTALLAGIALWFDVDIFMRTIFLIKSIADSKNPFNINHRTIVKKMLDGVPFDEIEVPDARTYDCKINKANLAQYQHFFFMNRVWYNDEESIAYAVQSMEQCVAINYIVTETAYLQAHTNVYYDLLFYYCHFNFNYYRAEKIFNIVKHELMNDHDSNGYRTLAYYYYYIIKDTELARNCLKNALGLLDEFPIVSQREYEKMLINRLYDIMLIDGIGKNINNQNMIG